MKPSTVALLLVYTSTTYAASLVDQAPPSEGAEYLFPVDGSEIKLDLGTEGNTLHECQNTTVSWTGAFTGRNVTTTISIGARMNHTWLDDWEEVKSGQSSYNFQASYPAGAVLYLSVMSGKTWPNGTSEYKHGYLNHINIVSGKQMCIPAAHYPVVLDRISLTNLTSCQRSTIHWTGGQAPYTVSVNWDSYERDGFVNYKQWEELGTVNDTSFGWFVNHPKGSQLAITVQSESVVGRHAVFNSGSSDALTVMESYWGDSCVPNWHKPNQGRRLPLWAIILVSVLGGALAMPIIAGVVFFAIKTIRAMRRSEGTAAEREGLLARRHAEQDD